tara:strand:- start:259 stop:489 length:231 start_codon:yes stop_codon:yes gene_type:complete
MSDHNFDWDDLEGKALAVFERIADKAEYAYDETEAAELAKGAAQMLQGIVALRQQRIAEQNMSLDKNPLRLTKKKS